MFLSPYGEINAVGVTTHVAFGLVGKIAISRQDDEVDKEVAIIFRAAAHLKFWPWFDAPEQIMCLNKICHWTMSLLAGAPLA